MYYLEYADKKDAKELYDLQKLAFLSEAEMTGSRHRFRTVLKRSWAGTAGTDLYAVANHYVSVGVVHNIG